MAEGGNWHVVEPREITVLDRIGGGDGFVGGMLYAILKGWEPEKWVQFGWASGALGHHAADRLRPARRRRAGLEHLEGQRPRETLSGRTTVTGTAAYEKPAQVRNRRPSSYAAHPRRLFRRTDS